MPGHLVDDNQPWSLKSSSKTPACATYSQLGERLIPTKSMVPNLRAWRRLKPGEAWCCYRQDF